ncbi:MAG: DNA-binding transcriptional regulator KdgR [Candidatus Competibacteraceae bacterium]|nr:DNA-binding transcriptional regulator KdgR [Candidatus Competibacteraceae bacterium]
MDAVHDNKPPESVTAVLRVFGLLMALSERKEMSISDLSIRLAMPKATVYRFLQTMKSLGFVYQEPESERYGLTMKLFELGAKVLQHVDMLELAKSQMQILSEKTLETIHLGVLADGEVVYVHKVDARHYLGMYSRVGRRAPVYATAIGKAMLAWEKPARRDAIIADLCFIRVQKNSVTSAEQFLAELESTRQRGYGLDNQEFEEHVICISVPIFDHWNDVVGGLSISIPEFRFDPDRQEEYANLLITAGREVSQALGCSVYPPDQK